LKLKKLIKVELLGYALNVGTNITPKEDKKGECSIFRNGKIRN